jgi:hypothetical protein
LSTFEVSPEHIQALVSAAAALGIAQLARPNGSTELLQLDRDEGQQKLLALLHLQQGSHFRVGAPEGPNLRQQASSKRLRSSWMNEPAQLVQVVQWVRCYAYQCSSASSWPGSDAEALCSQMLELLLNRLAKVFGVTWTVEPD